MPTDRAKAIANRNKASDLNDAYKVGAAQSRVSAHQDHWGIFIFGDSFVCRCVFRFCDRNVLFVLRFGIGGWRREGLAGWEILPISVEWINRKEATIQSRQRPALQGKMVAGASTMEPKVSFDSLAVSSISRD